MGKKAAKAPKEAPKAAPTRADPKEAAKANVEPKTSEKPFCPPTRPDKKKAAEQSAALLSVTLLSGESIGLRFPPNRASSGVMIKTVKEAVAKQLSEAKGRTMPPSMVELRWDLPADHGDDDHPEDSKEGGFLSDNFIVFPVVPAPALAITSEEGGAQANRSDKILQALILERDFLHQLGLRQRRATMQKVARMLPGLQVPSCSPPGGPGGGAAVAVPVPMGRPLSVPQGRSFLVELLLFILQDELDGYLPILRRLDEILAADVSSASDDEGVDDAGGHNGTTFYQNSGGFFSGLERIGRCQAVFREIVYLMTADEVNVSVDWNQKRGAFEFEEGTPREGSTRVPALFAVLIAASLADDKASDALCGDNDFGCTDLLFPALLDWLGRQDLAADTVSFCLGDSKVVGSCTTLPLWALSVRDGAELCLAVLRSPVLGLAAVNRLGGTKSRCGPDEGLLICCTRQDYAETFERIFAHLSEDARLWPHLSGRVINHAEYRAQYRGRGRSQRQPEDSDDDELSDLDGDANLSKYLITKVLTLGKKQREDDDEDPDEIRERHEDICLKILAHPRFDPRCLSLQDATGSTLGGHAADKGFERLGEKIQEMIEEGY